LRRQYAEEKSKASEKSKVKDEKQHGEGKAGRSGGEEDMDEEKLHAAGKDHGKAENNDG